MVSCDTFPSSILRSFWRRQSAGAQLGQGGERGRIPQPLGRWFILDRWSINVTLMFDKCLVIYELWWLWWLWLWSMCGSYIKCSSMSWLIVDWCLVRVDLFWKTCRKDRWMRMHESDCDQNCFVRGVELSSSCFRGSSRLGASRPQLWTNGKGQQHATWIQWRWCYAKNLWVFFYHLFWSIAFRPTK